MSWELAASIAEVVSAIAVVVSLIYLANEVRQNTIASRTSTHQQYIDTQANVNRGVSDDAEMAALVARAENDFESLSDEELIRLQFVFFNHFNQWHFAFTSRQKSLLEEEMFSTVARGYTGYMQSSTAFQRMWEVCGFAYDEQFRKFVEQLIADSKMQHQYPGFRGTAPPNKSVESDT